MCPVLTAVLGRGHAILGVEQLDKVRGGVKPGLGGDGGDGLAGRNQLQTCPGEPLCREPFVGRGVVVAAKFCLKGAQAHAALLGHLLYVGLFQNVVADNFGQLGRLFGEHVADWVTDATARMGQQQVEQFAQLDVFQLGIGQVETAVDQTVDSPEKILDHGPGGIGENSGRIFTPQTLLVALLDVVLGDKFVAQVGYGVEEEGLSEGVVGVLRNVFDVVRPLVQVEQLAGVDGDVAVAEVDAFTSLPYVADGAATVANGLDADVGGRLMVENNRRFGLVHKSCFLIGYGENIDRGLREGKLVINRVGWGIWSRELWFFHCR